MRTLTQLLLFALVCTSEQPSRIPFALDELSFTTEWYGVYLGDEKVGAASLSMERKGRGDGERFILSSEVRLKIRALGEKLKSTMTESQEFEAREPFRLLGGHSEVTQGRFVEEIVLEREGDRFLATIRRGGEKETRLLDGVAYDLVDAMTPMVWVTQGPAPEDRLRVRTFSISDLEEDTEIYEIVDVLGVVTDGIRSALFDVAVSTDSDGPIGRYRLTADGHLVSMTVGGELEIRLEPKRLARNFDYSADLFVMGMVEIDRPLGDLKTVTGLVVEVDPGLAALLKDSAWQSVVRDEESGAIELRVGEEFGVRQQATAEEIEENLAETMEFPVTHERIELLAREAVGDAATPREKTERLVEFVHGYLKEDLSAEPLGVLDILNVRRGDCTEFSQLFVTLSRASGVPARAVSGLLYIGDEIQGFGGHAWNEVVLDGHWVPVDAAWGEIKINATHIRFDETLESQVGFLTSSKGVMILKDVQR
jgi:hypothetical protein